MIKHSMPMRLSQSTGLILDNRLAKGRALITFAAVSWSTQRRYKLLTPAIYAIGDCIAIDDKPCRFVAPLREQAAAIAHHISDMAHAGYQHKSPLIRLKPNPSSFRRLVKSNKPKTGKYKKIPMTS